eukprot:CAMPEP_0195105020 /NCGR_PEP_ID=MMETSP0448-20130528/74630_1 /TAXON_ID=66468 /ORGANISM="Heterocapsa triquestra, Strain CCMP 448" /LENGTH=37 /DNA_ID= /DNA_START= /DNA_END= /DNA_ORIENTATION=
MTNKDLLLPTDGASKASNGLAAIAWQMFVLGSTAFGG